MEAAQGKHDGGDAKRRPLGWQERFGALETEALERLRKALGAGQHRLGELDQALSRVSKEDWSVEGMRRRLELFRARAEHLRATALKRVNEMPGTAVTALASGSRVPVQNLARELERLARLVEPHGSAARSAAPVEGVVDPQPAEVVKPARSRPQKVDA